VAVNTYTAGTNVGPLTIRIQVAGVVTSADLLRTAP